MPSVINFDGPPPVIGVYDSRATFFFDKHTQFPFSYQYHKQYAARSKNYSVRYQCCTVVTVSNVIQIMRKSPPDISSPRFSHTISTATP